MGLAVRHGPIENEERESSGKKNKNKNKTPSRKKSIQVTSAEERLLLI